jgi:hypothetical protein
MKVAKPTTVTVELVTEDGQRGAFELEHAERLLRMPNNGGWRLPDASPYQFDYYDGITRRTDSTRADESAEA